MSSRSSVGTFGMLMSVLAALALTIMPLPAAIEDFRPDWVMMMLIYWAMVAPQKYSVGTAWLIGIVMDVAQGTMLGQHALTMCLIVFVTIRFHLQMRVFPLTQLTLTVMAMLSAYQFLLFWINGVAGVTAPATVYWGPVITGTLIWPALSMFMNGLRFRRG
ncbi:MAG: rod shape-determining protein MreD [Woeseiaceae bacterium]|nr:rod shape-determining protein MreD [Woeseiaceae bacterium]